MVPGRVRGRGGPAGALALGAGCVSRDARRDGPGTLLSLGVSRFRFFGRETVSFIVILPIALPGIITGLALQTTFQNFGVDVRAADDHHRPRDLLHRRRLQQRARAAAAPVGLVRGGLGRPRRRLLANLSLRDLPGAADGASCGRAARVRTLVRRGRSSRCSPRARSRRSRSGSSPRSGSASGAAGGERVVLFVIVLIVIPVCHLAAVGPGVTGPAASEVVARPRRSTS